MIVPAEGVPFSALALLRYVYAETSLQWPQVGFDLKRRTEKQSRKLLTFCAPGFWKSIIFSGVNLINIRKIYKIFKCHFDFIKQRIKV